MVLDICRNHRLWSEVTMLLCIFIQTWIAILNSVVLLLSFLSAWLTNWGTDWLDRRDGRCPIAWMKWTEKRRRFLLNKTWPKISTWPSRRRTHTVCRIRLIPERMPEAKLGVDFSVETSGEEQKHRGMELREATVPDENGIKTHLS